MIAFGNSFGDMQSHYSNTVSLRNLAEEKIWVEYTARAALMETVMSIDVSMIKKECSQTIWETSLDNHLNKQTNKQTKVSSWKWLSEY